MFFLHKGNLFLASLVYFLLTNSQIKEADIFYAISFFYKLIAYINFCCTRVTYKLLLIVLFSSLMSSCLYYTCIMFLVDELKCF